LAQSYLDNIFEEEGSELLHDHDSARVSKAGLGDVAESEDVILQCWSLPIDSGVGSCNLEEIIHVDLAVRGLALLEVLRQEVRLELVPCALDGEVEASLLGSSLPKRSLIEDLNTLGFEEISGDLPSFRWELGQEAVALEAYADSFGLGCSILDRQLSNQFNSDYTGSSD
jgi:hypothetical protein